MKTLIIVSLLALAMVGCVPLVQKQAPIQPQEVIITLKAGEPVDVEVEQEKDKIAKSISLENPELELSQCKISGTSAYLTIESMIWAENIWEDFKLLREWNIQRLYVYLNSPGGNTSQGFAITDELRLLRESGIEIIIQARGTIASAAIPIFLQGTERICTESTIFLIHPSAIVKWGLFFETLKDIESQAEMMKINRNNYAELVSSSSKLSKDTVLEMLEKDTWFTAQKAQDWGLVDKIE